jgi:mannonate dehydratase
VRSKFGFNEHLLHDMHHRLTPIEAARFGKSIEEFRMFWMEDPTPAENQACFRLIRQHTVTPIAVGEVFNSIWDCKQLIEEQLIDYIRTTITHAGGITGMRRIADARSIRCVPARTAVGSVAGMPRRRAAFRPVGAELWRAGIYGLFRTDAGSLPAQLAL